VGSHWGVLSWVKRKLGLHKQLALLCVHPLAPGTQQKNAATRTKWLAARVFPVRKDWILVHALQNNEWVGQALSYSQKFLPLNQLRPSISCAARRNGKPKLPQFFALRNR